MKTGRGMEHQEGKGQGRAVNDNGVIWLLLEQGTFVGFAIDGVRSRCLRSPPLMHSCAINAYEARVRKKAAHPLSLHCIIAHNQYRKPRNDRCMLYQSARKQKMATPLF